MNYKFILVSEYLFIQKFECHFNVQINRVIKMKFQPQELPKVIIHIALTWITVVLASNKKETQLRERDIYLENVTKNCALLN